MRRSVEQLAKRRTSRLGRSSLRGMTLLVVVAASASAGDGDLPELTPPSDMPIVSKPSTPPGPAQAKPSGATNRANRPMLALPGLTTPAARPSGPVLEARPTFEALPGELSLDAPLEMKPQGAPSTAKPASRTSRPLVLESTSKDDLEPLGTPTRPDNPSTKRPTTPPQPVPAPSRRARFFGLLPGQNASPSRITGVPTASKTSTPGRASVEGLRDDPATESALKRRIERQAREVVGNRARSVEVKVSGKEAVIRVEGVKFLQKRGVRKQLEGLPAIAGLRSTIEVED